jgi:hypothetical protein
MRQASLVGYSGKPIVQKLGIKPGFCIFAPGAPSAYGDIVDKLPDDVTIATVAKVSLDMVHVFVTRANGSQTDCGATATSSSPDGMIWVSWPKKSSGVRPI